jgi:hypothetical protein
MGIRHVRERLFSDPGEVDQRIHQQKTIPFIACAAGVRVGQRAINNRTCSGEIQNRPNGITANRCPGGADPKQASSARAALHCRISDGAVLL